MPRGGTITDTAFTGERKLSVLSLFAGIGGFDLGLERTGGFETVAFCEIDPFCRRVLAKHWPGVPCHHGVSTLRGSDVGPIDVITGGFPCQDISPAGTKAGLSGERSGLWREFARLIGELRPRFVIVENSAALLDRGMGDVLGDLAALGFDAEWHCIPASALGAPHIRDRVWIVAYANEGGRRAPWAGEMEAAPADCLITSRELSEARSRAPDWPNRSDIPGIADGLPDIVDRGASIGNSLLPQIPELIGNAILASLHDFTGKARPLQAGERGQISATKERAGLAPSSHQSREDRACGLGAGSDHSFHDSEVARG